VGRGFAGGGGGVGDWGLCVFFSLVVGGGCGFFFLVWGGAVVVCVGWLPCFHRIRQVAGGAERRFAPTSWHGLVGPSKIRVLPILLADPPDEGYECLPSHCQLSHDPPKEFLVSIYPVAPFTTEVFKVSLSCASRFFPPTA